MVEHIINQLIITVGQWQKFGGKEYEQQFEMLLHQLMRETGTTFDEAVQMLEREVGIERVKVA